METATPEDFIKLGFVKRDDGSGDPRGIDYAFDRNGFHVWIDPWFDVYISREDSDQININVSDLSDLACVINFVCGEA